MHLNKNRPLYFFTAEGKTKDVKAKRNPSRVPLVEVISLTAGHIWEEEVSAEETQREGGERIMVLQQIYEMRIIFA